MDKEKARESKRVAARGNIEKRRRRGTGWAIVAALVFSIGLGMIGWRGLHTPSYHYVLSEELRLTFTNADEVIQQMRTGLQRHDQRIRIRFTTGTDHMADISALVQELMEFAYAETEDPSQGDYLRYQTGGYELEYGYEESDGVYTYELVITPDYYTTPEQEETVDEAVREIIQSMRFGRHTDDAEKVRQIYQFVYDTVEYDMVHRNNRKYHLKTTAYAALVRKRAVCQGYSVLTYRLFREAGVNARVITGTLKDGEGTEHHAWNLVEIDGAWYNLDVTWNKMLESDAYYLKTDRSMEDHVRDEAFATEPFMAQYPMAAQDYE